MKEKESSTAHVYRAAQPRQTFVTRNEQDLYTDAMDHAAQGLHMLTKTEPGYITLLEASQAQGHLMIAFSKMLAFCERIKGIPAPKTGE